MQTAKGGGVRLVGSSNLDAGAQGICSDRQGLLFRWDLQQSLLSGTRQPSVLFMQMSNIP